MEAAEHYGRLGMHREAAECYLKVGRRFDAASHLLSLGARDEAVDQMLLVPTTDSHYDDAAHFVVPVLVEGGSFDDALQRLNRVPAGKRDSGARSLDWRYWEARALEGLSRHEEATKLYQGLLKERSDFKDAFERLSSIKKEAGAATRTLGNMDAEHFLTVMSKASEMTAKTVLNQAATQVTPGGGAPSTGVGPGGQLGPGAVLSGRYEIKSEIGRGGMGQVFKGYDRELKEFVAIKTLLSSLADEASEERLLREVQICRKITHPNIVRVFDLGRFEGGIYVTMEFIAGLPLQALLEVPQKLSRIRHILAQVASGLSEAHALQVVHRDLKPGNIMVVEDRVKLLDFGIARMQGGGHTLTETGCVIGSPLYMSPEQLRGEELDARSDLYSLGVLAFTLVAGSEPFKGDNLTTIALGHLHNPPPDPSQYRGDLPKGWAEFIFKSMAKLADDRYQSAAEVSAAIQALPA